MLRTFTFNESKSSWIEEEHQLLLHDICAVLDEEREIIYLWTGPKSSRKKFRKAFGQVKELLSNFPELKIQFLSVEDNFPEEVNLNLKTMLGTIEMEKKKKLQLSRIITIRIYSISIIITVFLPFLLLLNLYSSLLWTEISGSYLISNLAYDDWINNSKLYILITLIFLFINIVIGVIEIENQIILFSVNGLIISIGLLLFFNQGVFLFLFQEGSTLSDYLIRSGDLIIFLLLNLATILIFETPNVYKLISFFKTYKKFIF